MAQPLTDPVAEVIRRAWVTKGARFAAHRRLTRKHIWSTWAISLLSTYVIAGSLIGARYLDLSDRSALDIDLVITSLLVIVLSLIEASRNYQLRAERLHASGMALGRLEVLLREVQAMPHSPRRAKRASLLVRRYPRLIEGCPDNHDEIDFDTFRARQPTNYPMSRRERCWITIRRHAVTIGPYFVAILVPPILFAILRGTLGAN